MMSDSYTNLTTADWENKIEKGMNLLEKCSLCPNKCGINRIKTKTGICGSGFFPAISSAFAHFGEEPPISGTNGSGAIFFSGCPLSCVYCQNYPISQQNVGTEIPFTVLAEHMINLQNQGCHDINLVTPTHFVPQIIIALKEACQKGLNIPIIYNTSSFESLETMELLEGIVDIYLADMRYAKDESAIKYSAIKNYAASVRTSIKIMAGQVGELKLDSNKIAQKGFIIRILLLPGLIEEAKSNIEFIAHELHCAPYISLMSQYFPAGNASNYPEINRSITKDEFNEAYFAMQDFGLNLGWVQEI